jgi:hypothetical protein
MNKETLLKYRAIHDHVKLNGSQPLPIDYIESYQNKVGTDTPDYVLGYKQSDVREEIELLDNSVENNHVEDMENMQDFSEYLLQQYE